MQLVDRVLQKFLLGREDCVVNMCHTGNISVNLASSSDEDDDEVDGVEAASARLKQSGSGKIPGTRTTVQELVEGVSALCKCGVDELLGWEQLDDLDDTSINDVDVNLAVRLCRDAFQANTAEGVRTKKRCWGMFCQFYKQEVLKVPAHVTANVLYPPSQSEWLKFLGHARNKCSTFDAMSCVVDVVCVVGDALARADAETKGKTWNGESPKLKYHAVHKKMMNLLLRTTSVGKRVVEGITMEEALSFPNFVDVSSFSGYMDAALFAMGCISIKRGRSLSSMLIKHVSVEAVLGYVTGSPEPILVPQMTFESHDEKIVDGQGVRSILDSVKKRKQYEVWGPRGVSYWLYRLLVLRGAFQEDDPLINAKAGDKLQFKPEALLWYVFCSVHGDVFSNCEPMSVAGMGVSTARVLMSMGSKPRGFSAHRRGGATRCIIMALLSSRGRKIDPALESAMLRWGGWSQKTGLHTLRTVYESKQIDLYLDRYSLSFGRVDDEDFWKEQVQDYLSVKGRPVGHVLVGCENRAEPIAVRIAVQRDVTFSKYVREVDTHMRQLMTCAKQDSAVMLIGRYVEDREAYSLAMKKYDGSPLHRKIIDGARVRSIMWHDALLRVQNKVICEGQTWCKKWKIVNLYWDWKFVKQCIAPVGFGNFDHLCASGRSWKTVGIQIDDLKLQTLCCSKLM